MSSINSYLSFIDPIPSLSREEEKELIIKAQAGNQAARTKLIKANILYVAKVVNNYSNRGELEDIMAWGCMGLNKAISKFNVNSGYKLITYADYCIRSSINDNTKNQKSVKCNTSLDDFLSGDSEDTILEKICADKILTPEEELIHSELHRDLDVFLSSLPERDATIIKAHAGYGYDKPLSLSKIGEIVGLSKGGVHEVEKRINKSARSGKTSVDFTDYLAA